jgi:hypothetical protein
VLGGPLEERRRGRGRLVVPEILVLSIPESTKLTRRKLRTGRTGQLVTCYEISSWNSASLREGA